MTIKRKTHNLRFAGYSIEVADKTVIHRPAAPRPAWYLQDEYGSDPILNEEGEPTGKVRMVPSGRIVDVPK